MPTLVIPEAEAVIPATELADCDAVLERLTKSKQAWVETSVPERIKLLKACMDASLAAADEWVAASCKGKGFAAGSAGEG